MGEFGGHGVADLVAALQQLHGLANQDRVDLLHDAHEGSHLAQLEQRQAVGLGSNQHRLRDVRQVRAGLDGKGGDATPRQLTDIVHPPFIGGRGQSLPAAEEELAAPEQGSDVQDLA
ncbi:ferredoxin-NADP reductase [Arthrobacter globiformis]|nr:ferredoxin-NADP reductase [Arthrobacter globiformis]